MNTEQIKYVIITPVRDEERYIRDTIQSVRSQTVKPKQWIIVNDGSTDRTADVIKEYTYGCRWIRTLHRGNRGYRKSGAGVVEAFYDGYNSLDYEDWEFLVKLDADLRFDESYFEHCFNHFLKNPKLGIGGGMVYNLLNKKERAEKTPIFHVRGATKIYRRACWDDIGGLIRAPGWDTVDELKANMLGWQTTTFSNLRVVQLKPTGTAEGKLKDLVKGGRAAYISGYHPAFMALRCLRRIFLSPYIVGAFALLYGYCRGYFDGTKRVDDGELIKFIRRQQVNKILGRNSIWR